MISAFCISGCAAADSVIETDNVEVGIDNQDPSASALALSGYRETVMRTPTAPTSGPQLLAKEQSDIRNLTALPNNRAAWSSLEGGSFVVRSREAGQTPSERQFLGTQPVRRLAAIQDQLFALSPSGDVALRLTGVDPVKVGALHNISTSMTTISGKLYFALDDGCIARLDSDGIEDILTCEDVLATSIVGDGNELYWANKNGELFWYQLHSGLVSYIGKDVIDSDLQISPTHIFWSSGRSIHTSPRRSEKIETAVVSQMTVENLTGDRFHLMWSSADGSIWLYDITNHSVDRVHHAGSPVSDIAFWGNRLFYASGSNIWTMPLK